MGDVFIEDDRTFNRIVGEVLNLDRLIDVGLLGSEGSVHFVGLDLSEVVLSSEVSAEVDEVTDFLFEVSGDVFAEVFGSHHACDMHGCFEVLVFEVGSDLLTVVETFSHGFGEFLHQSGFGLDELVFEGDVACFSHVQSDYQPFDQIVLGFEVFKSDLFETVEYFEIVGSVFDDGFEFFIFSFSEDLTFAVSGERTGDGHVDLS